LALAKDPRISGITPDYEIYTFSMPGGGNSTPPEAEIPAGVYRVGAPSVWDDWTGAGVGVAVVDSGLDFNHPDLPVAPESFVSPDFAYYTTSAQDDNGHGTRVGGVIAAKRNGEGVVGVAPGATLYAVKVLDNGGFGTDSDLIAGLNWVLSTTQMPRPLDPPIKVVNISLGRPAGDHALLYEAIQNLLGAGITVVAAAGNNEHLEVSQVVPAGFPGVIAVASTTARDGTSNSRRIARISADTASSFTTDGQYDPLTDIGIAISAPGEEQVNVNSPYTDSLGILTTSLGGTVSRFSGTSIAAPHAAGVAALLLCKEPGLTPAEVKRRLMLGDRKNQAPCDPMSGAYSFDGEREGILSARNALGLESAREGSGSQTVKSYRRSFRTFSNVLRSR
jgi:subtilisin family serine protease